MPVEVRTELPPSIAALRIFDAASRLESFTAAADELSLTQSAVSHAVRELEARLSVALFRRTGRGVELTEAGKRYAPFVREALARLRAGDLAIRDPDRRSRVLTVSVSPSFAAKWLGPRIGEFAALHPDLDLRVSATAQHVDFTDDDVDLAVRHGNGDWPTLKATRLCSEMWLPVAAPTMAGGVRRASDLLRKPLIHHRDAAQWRRWFEEEGVGAAEPRLRGVIFSEMSLAIDAAVAGQGVALSRSALAARDLIAGRLVCLTKSRRQADFAYWAVWPKDRARTRKVARFTDWLRAEAAKEEKSLADLLA
jgi:LysR family glycine cleavage system transcriptional activator